MDVSSVCCTTLYVVVHPKIYKSAYLLAVLCIPDPICFTSLAGNTPMIIINTYNKLKVIFICSSAPAFEAHHKNGAASAQY